MKRAIIEFLHPQGRIGRTTYCVVVAAFGALVAVSARATGASIVEAINSPWATLGRAIDTSGLVTALPASAALSLAVTVVGLGIALTFLTTSNRLHDFGRSGWWALLLLLPIVGPLLVLTCAIVPGRRPAAT